MKTIIFYLLFSAVFADSAVQVFPFKYMDSKWKKVTWQSQESAKVEIKDSKLVFTFDKPRCPVWNSHLNISNWEGFNTLVLRFLPGDSGKFAVGVLDRYNNIGVFPFEVSNKSRSIEIPISAFYLQGIAIDLTNSFAVWSLEDNPVTINIEEIMLDSSGFNASIIKRGTLVLLNAEGKNANEKFRYNSKKVSVSDEHATEGKHSYLCDIYKVPEKDFLHIMRWIPHDWRGYKRTLFDVYWPFDKPNTLRFTVVDSRVPGFGNRTYFDADVNLKPGLNNISIDLKDFKYREGQKSGVENVNWRYIEKIGWQILEKDGKEAFYLDNVRLEGDGKISEEIGILRKNVPSWGYDKLKTIDIPGDFRKINIPLPLDKPTLYVGAGKSKITPPIGTPIDPSGVKSEGVLDDIYIRALVMNDGINEVVMLSLETLQFPGRAYFPNMLSVTEACAKEAGVKPNSIYLSATHNHTSGVYYQSKIFNELFVDGGVKAVKEAKSKTKPVIAGIATTIAGFNCNRNLKVGRYYPLLDFPFIVDLINKQPADKELGALVFTDNDGSPVAFIVNYAAHANMAYFYNEFSGDWPGWASRLIEDKTGGICLVVPGGCGNLVMKEFDYCDYSSVIKVGRDVAVETLLALTDLKRLKGLDIKKEGGIGIYNAKGVGSPRNDKKKFHSLPVRALKIGPVIFIDPYCEYFTEFVLDIKKRSKSPYTFVTFSMGTGNYIGPSDWMTNNKDWGQVIADTAVKLIEDIYSGREMR